MQSNSAALQSIWPSEKLWSVSVETVLECWFNSIMHHPALYWQVFLLLFPLILNQALKITIFRLWCCFFYCYLKSFIVFLRALSRKKPLAELPHHFSYENLSFLPVSPSFHTSISPCEGRCWMTIGGVKHWWRPCTFGPFQQPQVEPLSSRVWQHWIWYATLTKGLWLSVGRLSFSPSLEKFHMWPLAPGLTSSQGGLGSGSRHDGLTLLASFSISHWRLQFTVKMSSSNPILLRQSMQFKHLQYKELKSIHPTNSLSSQFQRHLFLSHYISIISLLCLFAPHLPLPPYIRYNKGSAVMPSGWSRAPPPPRESETLPVSQESCYLTEQSVLSVRSQQKPSLIVLCSPAPELRTSPNAKTAHITAERREGRYPPENRRLLISAIVPFSSVLRGEALMWAQRDSECLREPYNSNDRYKTLIGCINPMIVT